jgi:hypothetical protein
VAVDPSGKVHIAATGADNGGIWYASNATGSWVEQRVVAPWNSDLEMTGTVDEATIAIDPSDGSVWIAFIYWDCGDCAPGWSSGIFVTNNTAGTWSEPLQLTQDDGAIYPSLAVRSGHVYLAWAVAGDYVHRYGPVVFGTDASGVWETRQVARAGAYPRIAINASGAPVILFGGDSVRYAHQKSSGSFGVETLPGTAGSVGHFAHPITAVDPATGDIWAAWTTHSGEYGQVPDVFVATRGSDGWSDPMSALPGGELIGLGVREGVVQLAAEKNGIAYANNAGGAFVEQFLYRPSNFYWGDGAFALLPSGRPVIVIARDIPSNDSGLWLLKGPPV